MTLDSKSAYENALIGSIYEFAKALRHAPIEQMLPLARKLVGLLEDLANLHEQPATDEIERLRIQSLSNE